MNIRIIMGTLAVLSFLSAPAHADDHAKWLTDQKAAFKTWVKAHPDAAAKIADLKTKTTALLHAQPALDPAGTDKPPVIWPVAGAPTELWDDPAAPRMIVIPAGEYSMGSPENEPGRKDRESPLHRVRVGYPLAVGKYDVTVAEFAEFVAESGYPAGDCYTKEDGKGAYRNDRSWRNPSFVQKDSEPVVCVDWDDAKAYVEWLSKKTGHVYRLLSEAEYEYANRAGTATLYWWGNDIGVNHANCDGCGSAWDHTRTSPPESFPANPFGLFDTTGNIWSWTEDCWNENYAGAPTDGSANTSGPCKKRILHGGSTNDKPAIVRSAFRASDDTFARGTIGGFRIARVL